jgi:DNA polymerase III epsilon subunit-like protein
LFQQATNDIIYPPTEEHIPRECENCLIVSYDLETTGLSSEDEIIQIGAHTNIPASHRTSDFNQFILPATRSVQPEAAAKIGLQVREDGLYDSR